jgi:hypothetical protein
MLFMKPSFFLKLNGSYSTSHSRAAWRPAVLSMSIFLWGETLMTVVKLGQAIEAQ